MRRKAPAVSVIVPVYKAEKFLHRCIDSILAQTFRNFELILIDDGSPDGSGAICDEYAAKDGRVRVFHQENRGVARTRERGVALARGTYLIWVDSDDWIDARLLEKTMGVHETMGADIVLYGACVVSHGKKEKYRLVKEKTQKAYRDAAIYGKINNVTTCSSRKCLWEDMAVPKELAMSGEDGYMAMHFFMKASRIEALQDILYYCDRDNEQSITHEYSGRRCQGNAWSWYYRFQVSRSGFPECTGVCAMKAMSNGVKAYALSLLLGDLTGEERERLKDLLQEVLPCAGYRRLRDRFLAWAILHGHLGLARRYAAWKLQKEARHNERIKNRRE